MKRTALVLSAALAAAASIATPVLAEGVVRPGDMTMSCEALAGEINTLEEAQIKHAQRAESGRKFMGFAGAALNAAAPSLMARAGTSDGAMLAQGVLGAVQSGAVSASTSTPAAAADASPQARRLERVKGLFAERGC